MKAIIFHSRGLSNISVEITRRKTEIAMKIPNLILHSLRTQTQPYMNTSKSMADLETEKNAARSYQVEPRKCHLHLENEV
jgi:hypothetical protein